MNWTDEWQRVQRTLARAESFAAKHPRTLTGTVVGALSCFAVTAFGVAPMAPDAADLPQRIPRVEAPPAYGRLWRRMVGSVSVRLVHLHPENVAQDRGRAQPCDRRVLRLE